MAPLEVRSDSATLGKALVVVDTDAQLAAAIAAVLDDQPEATVTVRRVVERRGKPKILVNRIGFLRTSPDATPERALQWALREMRERGHRIITVAITPVPVPATDAYEAFIVSEVLT